MLNNCQSGITVFSRFTQVFITSQGSKKAGFSYFTNQYGAKYPRR